MSAASERWFAFAQEDLLAAELLFEEQIYNQVCFHAQQCVEKSLKGLLAHDESAPPRTHSITDLVQLLPEETLTDLRNEVGSLDDYYIPTRYPDALPGSLPEGLPGKKQAQEALALARSVFNRVTDNAE